MMQVSNRTHHALRLMAKLACWQEQRPCPLNELADEIQISLSYAEILVRDLREAGFVRSRRGPGGGYTLAKHAQLIRLVDVADAIDGKNYDPFLGVVCDQADLQVSRFCIADIMGKA